MTYDDSQDGLDPPADHMHEDGFGDVIPESRSHTLASVLWPVYIFIRPRAFFESIAVSHNPMLTLACVWVFGMSNATNRLAKIIRGPVDSQPLDDSWTLTWAAILGLGLVAGGIAYVIGGWWYSVRLRWSGVEAPSRRVATRVYISAAQVMAVPNVAMAAIASTVYATPFDAAISPELGTWSLVMILLMLWSYVVSYVGVRTVFRARLWPSRFWFLILPSALIIGVFVAAFAVGLALRGSP